MRPTPEEYVARYGIRGRPRREHIEFELRRKRGNLPYAERHLPAAVPAILRQISELEQELARLDRAMATGDDSELGPMERLDVALYRREPWRWSETPEEARAFDTGRKVLGGGKRLAELTEEEWEEADRDLAEALHAVIQARQSRMAIRKQAAEHFLKCRRCKTWVRVVVDDHGLRSHLRCDCPSGKVATPPVAPLPPYPESGGKS